MTRPDRFERMVGKHSWHDEAWSKEDAITVKDAIDLLRQEHAWMRRTVRDVQKWSAKDIITKDDIFIVLCERLTQRRK